MTKKDRNDYIRIAREIGYSSYVIDQLCNAKDESECIRIMKTARIHFDDKQGGILCLLNK